MIRNSEIFVEVDGVKTDDTRKIANGFSKFFANISQNIKEISIPLTDFCWRMPTLLSHLPTSVGERRHYYKEIVVVCLSFDMFRK